MLYRIYRDGNRKQFVETQDIKLIKSILKEETRNGHKVEIREQHGKRWYKIEL